MSVRSGAPARLLALALASGAGAASLALGAGPAAAHARLERTDPADGASLGAGPGVVRLVFDEAVQDALATVVVTGPGGDVVAGAPEIVDGTVDQPVAAEEAGDYRVAYRVVSADGHPVSGELSFTVTAAPAAPGGSSAPSAGSGTTSAPPASSPSPAASPATSPAAAAPAVADEGGGHAQHLVPLAAVAAAAVVVVGVTTWTGRRDRSGGGRGS